MLGFRDRHNLWLSINQSDMNRKSKKECTPMDVYWAEYVFVLAIIFIWMTVTRHTGFSVLACLVTIFFAVGLFKFPNGPVSFPHPVFWRLVFGYSVLHLSLVILALCLPYDVVRAQIVRLDPTIDITVPEIEGEDCYPLTVVRVWDSVFHTYGWCHIVNTVSCTMCFRHAPTLWAGTLLWEIVERVFSPMYPFMWECWWNSIFTDILICNGVGITLGVFLYRRLGLDDQNWHWNRTGNAWVAAFHVGVMLFGQHVIQWTTLALVDTFKIPEFHIFGAVRLYGLAIATIPGCRGYYLHATDYENTRMGVQSWIFLAIYLLEIAVCVKFGYEKLMRLTLLALSALFFCYVAFSVFIVFFCRFMDGNKNYFASHSKEKTSSTEIRSNLRVSRRDLSGNDFLFCNGELRRNSVEHKVKVRKLLNLN